MGQLSGLKRERPVFLNLIAGSEEAVQALLMEGLREGAMIVDSDFRETVINEKDGYIRLMMPGDAADEMLATDGREIAPGIVLRVKKSAEELGAAMNVTGQIGRTATPETIMPVDLAPQSTPTLADVAAAVAVTALAATTVFDPKPDPAVEKQKRMAARAGAVKLFVAGLGTEYVAEAGFAGVLVEGFKSAFGLEDVVDWDMRSHFSSGWFTRKAAEAMPPGSEFPFESVDKDGTARIHMVKILEHNDRPSDPPVPSKPVAEPAGLSLDFDVGGGTGAPALDDMPQAHTASPRTSGSRPPPPMPTAPVNGASRDAGSETTFVLRARRSNGARRTTNTTEAKAFVDQASVWATLLEMTVLKPTQLGVKKGQERDTYIVSVSDDVKDRVTAEITAAKKRYRGWELSIEAPRPRPANTDRRTNYVPPPPPKPVPHPVHKTPDRTPPTAAAKTVEVKPIFAFTDDDQATVLDADGEELLAELIAPAMVELKPAARKAVRVQAKMYTGGLSHEDLVDLLDRLLFR